MLPTAYRLERRAQYIVDGTLLPCWSWAARKDLYFLGKHKTTGMNVLVACTLEGCLSWISDPVPGSRHDSYIVKDSSVFSTAMDPHDYVGDKGFVGNGMITPFKKPAGGELLDLAEGIQQPGEQDPLGRRAGDRELQDLAHMHTDYRRPIGTFT